ncbi:hypothetical protein V2J09_022193 [Rumex salicifolius]
MESPRAVNVYMAKLAEKAERYDDMVEFMEKVVAEGGGELNANERKLLTLSFHYACAPRRKSWLFVSELNPPEVGLILAVKDWRDKIESKISTDCERFLTLLDSKLIPSADTFCEKVLYSRLRGDFNRCLSELYTSDKLKLAVKNAFTAYKASQELAMNELRPLHVERVRAAINHAEYHYDSTKDAAGAIKIAKMAYGEETEGRSVPKNVLVARLQDKISSGWSIQHSSST